MKNANRIAIATINTENGPTTIYYNGANTEITDESGNAIEEIDCCPRTIVEAFDIVHAMCCGFNPNHELEALEFFPINPDFFDEASEIADRIRNAAEWDPDDCYLLCQLAGMLDEWEEADGDTFESVIYAAADALNVKI